MRLAYSLSVPQMNAAYRDSRGRFRKPTDEERWPDPAVRASRKKIASYFAVAKDAWAAAQKQSLKDLEFISGRVWQVHA